MPSFLSKSREDTLAFAEAYAKTLRGGDVVLLDGDMGAGKTVFARAFIRTLTAENEDVPSPTFTLVQTYDTSKEPFLTVWHFDLYRLKSAQEIYEIGFEEALTDGVSLIEWPERAERLLARDRLEIQLRTSPEGTDKRILTLTACGKSWQNRMEEIDSCRNALNS